MLALLFAGCSGAGNLAITPEDPVYLSPEARATAFLAGCKQGSCGFTVDQGAAIDTLGRAADGVLEVWLNDAWAQVPSREADVEAVIVGIQTSLAEDSIRVYALEQPIRELVPNHLRTQFPIDSARRPSQASPPRPLVQFPDRAPSPSRGLAGRHIALWASHGWYYEAGLDRWEWQRARLFTSVEDILPTGFVLPYLAPMLERAGAYVWMPRERDPQTTMVVIDNDADAGSHTTYRETCTWRPGEAGFAPRNGPYETGENPWEAGTHSYKAAGNGACAIRWEGNLGQGRYAVYVGYGQHANATDSAAYQVAHAGGVTRVLIDQRMAYDTWVYLGSYQFDGPASVTLTDQSPQGTIVSGDAVRFGGGMGLISRNGQTSGRPRWQEGARYSLQYDGMPASLVYNVTDAAESDYVDDYRNRGEWVNYLRGAPLGPNKDPSVRGLGVPIDVSMAFHTDAGVTSDRSTIGTLSIYSSRGYGPDGTEAREFANGMSRFANRDLADLMQSQIVEDVRSLYDSTWTRRSLWDRDYSEAYRPNVPSMLLELLSHQNFADMRFALDPRFRFDVSRSIYKALTRFVAAQYGEPDPVIAPLSPDHLAISGSGGTAVLSWRGRRDPLERSASATSYRIYRRKGQSGFDDGMPVTGTTVSLNVSPGVTSFYVTALNAGGESAPSEVVAVGYKAAADQSSGRGRVLVVSAFDRIGPPASVDLAGFRGFPEFLDNGVADRLDLSFTGAQHQFAPAEPWVDDDQPGHGASHANLEAIPEPGNTFDFAAGAGADLLAAGAGQRFDTVSDEALTSGALAPDVYDVIYVLLGEERSRVPGNPTAPEYEAFSVGLRQALSQAREAGAVLIVSGSYPTEELAGDGLEFGKNVLMASHQSTKASRTGDVVGTAGSFAGLAAHFNTSRGGAVYAVEAPEALVPAASAETVLRYRDSNMSAAVAGPGAVTFGFPLETIEPTPDRVALFKAALQYLRQQR
ncbi:MAG: hypothetical protein ACI9W4_000829 [Rhodothermales bacterium]|jgi:hypothetical protein